MRLIDANAAIIDLREQIVAFFGEAKKKVKPEDYYITKLSAYHEDLERLQIDNFIAYLNSRPTINPEDCRAHGWWIEKEDAMGDTYYDCSVCGESFCLIDGTPTENLYKYCPNCGAKMDGKEQGNAD